MKSNKMGTHLKRDINHFFSSLFGRTTKFEGTESNLRNGVSFGESVGLDKQAKKAVLEAQLRESQAFEFIRKFQNC